MWYLNNPFPCLAYWKQLSFRSSLSACSAWINLLLLFQAIQKNPKPVSSSCHLLLLSLCFTMLSKCLLPATLMLTMFIKLLFFLLLRVAEERRTGPCRGPVREYLRSQSVKLKSAQWPTIQLFQKGYIKEAFLRLLLSTFATSFSRRKSSK